MSPSDNRGVSEGGVEGQIYLEALAQKNLLFVVVMGYISVALAEEFPCDGCQPVSYKKIGYEVINQKRLLTFPGEIFIYCSLGKIFLNLEGRLHM